MLIKGAPAVIQDLKELYTDRHKANEIEKVLLGFRDNMSRSSVLEPSDEEEQDPTVWVWLLYFLANHYLFTR
jgi:N-alpha-acetyltransferase 15/16, NatA auxiliary subunit